jgi:UDP-N-acetylglucosamine--N-acetylmuramyl-(pentapeptide) pyrophosphoryl-undecaprenol N-acetylglucosamine transferase
MPRVLEQSHLAVSRAGALSLAELMAAKVPAILIPLPSAADDHQSENAKTCEEAGAAITLLEKELNKDKLFSLIKGLINDKDRLTEMQTNTQSLVKDDSAQIMAKAILKTIEKRKVQKQV